jgi:chromosome segregation ATPase
MSGGGELHPWAEQVNAALAECTRRLAALEATVSRLDAHSSELARELLDVIERVDRQETEQRALSSRLADLERSDLEDRLGHRIERIAERLERSLGVLERRVDNHEGDHWRQGR